MYSERDPRMESTIILPYTENLYKGWVNNAKKDCEMVLAPSNPANETYGYCRMPSVIIPIYTVNSHQNMIWTG